MKNRDTGWRAVRHALRTMPLPAPAGGADDFWRDFHARRALHPQHSAVAPVRLFALFLRPALAAACAAVLLAGGLLLARGWGNAGRVAGHPYATDGRYASTPTPADDPTQAGLSGASGMELNEEEGGT